MQQVYLHDSGTHNYIHSSNDSILFASLALFRQMFILKKLNCILLIEYDKMKREVAMNDEKHLIPQEFKYAIRYSSYII